MNLKRIRAGLLILTIVFLALTTVTAQTRGVGVKVKKSDGQTTEVKLYDASYALVIGNSRYTNGWDNLAGVASDVVAVKQILESQGFVVETAENLTGDQFTARVSKFIRDYGFLPNNRLLIYYAGHGHTLTSTGDEREVGYVVPVDAPLPQKDDLGFKQTAIPMDDIQNFARRIQSKHALFLFDSCFSGRLVTRNTIAVPPVIEEKVAFPVRQFITAGAANQPVPDESIFRRSFVRALEGEGDLNNDGYITGTELAEYLKEKVTNYSNRQQTPQYGKINDINLDRGDFIFVTGKTAKIPRPQEPDSTSSGDGVEKNKPVSGESAYWQIIENSADVRDFENYLARTKNGEFPGAFREAAEAKLFRLKKANSLMRWSEIKETAKSLLKYSNTYSFSKLYPIRVEANGKYGYINKLGQEVIPLKYDFALDFSNGFAAVRLDGKWGLIDHWGKPVLPFDYERIQGLSEGFGAVKLNGKWGFINQNGQLAIPPKYVEVGGFSEGLSAVRELTGAGFIDVTGKLVISVTYDGVGHFSEGLAAVRTGDSKTGKWGFIDKTGRLVIPVEYDAVSDFSEGFAAVQKNGKWGYIDKTGKALVPFEYDFAGNFSEGLGQVRVGDVKSGKTGFVDKTGRLVVPLENRRALNFSDGLAAVQTGDIAMGQWGYIDRTGKLVIPYKFDLAFSFSNPAEGGLPGLASVGTVDREFGFIDKTGRIVVPLKVTDLWCRTFQDEGIIGVVINGKKGYVDVYGNEYFDF